VVCANGPLLTYQSMMTSAEPDAPGVATLDTETLKLLADPLRAWIVGLLAAESLCVCHIVAETGAQQTNISNHLRALRQAELVETERVGRYTYYRLRPEPLEALGAQLGHLAAAARSSDQKRPCP
jgi:ArsR family transcriptional regulator, arsenate/arsenite/antimonite-responsive transcriptional repressor